MRKKEELIKEAKEMSKSNFLAFAKGIYAVDENIFEHLWNVPIISSLEDDVIIKTTLSTKNEDDILAILDDVIDDEMGESEACFIPFDKLTIEFEDDEINEYKSKIANSEITEDYNAFIVYNEPVINKIYKKFENKYITAENDSEKDRFENNFIKYMSSVFTHERCYLNTNTLLCNIHNPDLDELVNGAEVSFSEHEEDERYDFAECENHNEVLIETLATMITNYVEGDTIEDCLMKIVMSRKGQSTFDEIDDRMALSVYTIFPEEITNWLMFGAYDDTRLNVFDKKAKNIYGEDKNGNINRFSMKKLEEYSHKENLTDKQMQMLYEIGVSFNQDKIDLLNSDINRNNKSEKELEDLHSIKIDDIKEVATSITAIEELPKSFQDIKQAKTFQKDENIMDK